MSNVTNAILSFNLSDEHNVSVDAINAIFVNGLRVQRGFVSVDDPSLPSAWYGGSKMLETPILIAAFNHVNTDDILAHLRTLPWRYPEDVQLMVKRQESDRFEILTLTP